MRGAAVVGRTLKFFRTRDDTTPAHCWAFGDFVFVQQKLFVVRQFLFQALGFSCIGVSWFKPPTISIGSFFLNVFIWNVLDIDVVFM